MNPDQNKTKPSLKKAALHYHEYPRHGKIEVIPTKSTVTQEDLSLAYTPGVAQPCLEIAENPALADKYTAKGNLVAVVSNGSAVLGLGNIGPIAGKPVMEGKGVLFKKFADIDVFDIEVDATAPADIIDTVKKIAPTFGGINLEDIKAPECFEIEEQLKAELDIPVFHDDQHGTAIISGAALVNALELVDKKIGDIKIVISGAGAAGIACANFYISLGADIQKMLMVDSKGVLWNGRGDEAKNKYKAKFFRDTDARVLGDAVKGADLFCGVSVKDVLKPAMVKEMAAKPIIFAMANPDPEITYPLAKATRPDAIVATGRSDYPNQVNNVLGFPFIFRGALDVGATQINEAMKLAAAKALAALAKEEVPDSVKKAYSDNTIAFGPDYIIPKPFDPRVLTWAATAVAKAAMDSGVAKKVVDIEKYKEDLMQKIDWSRHFMRSIFSAARKNPKRIVFPEGDHRKIIWAASEIVQEGYAKPILLTKDKKALIQTFEELNHDIDGIEIIEPKRWPKKDEYIDEYYRLRQRKGKTRNQAAISMDNFVYFAVMMVRMGDADGMVAGVTANYPDVLRPSLKIIGTKHENAPLAGMYMLQHNRKNYFFADAAVNINPSAEKLADITLLAAEEMERLGQQPKVAMLSFSNFGSVRVPETQKIEAAVKIIKSKNKDLHVDGPVQPDVALSPDIMQEHYPFADIQERPNLLIFPNLDAGNISLRLIRHMSSTHTIGPIIIGMAKPIHLLPKGTSVRNIKNLTAIACVDASRTE
jgi:malate dehydrogenase (oxaloacetate-decarboxylating)(NADP+)